ncbi:MAG TPA: class I SAM-dependent methyltransferase [Actinomycetota bacterium]|jgi:SAM-dependent methyltransferase|nr:class I SAM-dependent methyltransferase [Actinomycetota bacterium]
MDDYRPETYGDRIADLYDRMTATMPDPVDCVDRLAELAGAGPALELGIGTGRVALPLAARGVEVHGVDASAAMVERLRAKPGGEAIPVTLGDFADLPVEGSFTLVYAVFNTFFSLLTQGAQVRCFQAVAGRLAPGGVFALELFVPDPTLHPGGQSIRTRHLGLDLVRFDLALHDPVAQRVDFQNVLLDADGARLMPGSVRYAWPSELDLMAGLAGMALRERWGGWRREPYTGSTSGLYVAVYEHAGGAAS